MAGIYDELQAVASGVFAEFNQGVIKFVAVVKGAGPAHNPGSPTRTEYTLAGAVARGPEFKFMSTGLAVASDKQVNCSVDSRFDPADYPAARMIIDGVEYKVKHFAALPAAGTPVAWKFLVEK
jgi:hypothetical protein